MWKYTGRERPPFAERPGPGQESVWDYPRPPRIAPDERRVEVRAIIGGQPVALADSIGAVRVLETAGPPTFYVPPSDVVRAKLAPEPGQSLCEWKGVARYWGLADAPGAPPVAWSYPEPNAVFESIRDHLAFYPGRVECRVAGERVRPQPGGFYGGWLTDEIVGPVKGAPGTEGW